MGQHAVIELEGTITTADIKDNFNYTIDRLNNNIQCPE